MSERISYMAGDVAGRDHINWPRITAAQLAALTGSSTARTAGCNLLTILALSWRVREFTLSGDASVTVEFFQIFGGEPISENRTTRNWTIPTVIVPMIITTPVQGFPVEDEHKAQTESDIVRFNDEAQFPAGLKFLHSYGFLGRNFENVNVTGHGRSVSIPEGIVTEVDFSNLSAQQVTTCEIFGPEQIKWSVVFDPGTQLFYPHIGMSLGINPGTSKPVGAGSGAGAGSGSLTIDPVIAPPITVPMHATVEMGTIDTLISLDGSINLTMTATKFWEHDGTYDPVSGAQLLDPFR